MNILFYISTIRGGGAARVMTNLANQFVEDGNKVCFITNFSEESEYFLDDKVIRFSVEEKESSYNFLRKNIHRIKYLRKVIKKEKPDIVVSFMHENDVRAYMATFALKTKLVLSVRNDPQTLYQNTIKKTIAKFVYSRADAVVFQTTDAKKWFGNRIKESRVIYNQVAEEFFEVERAEQCKDIITTGKFLPQKNHMLLMEAYKKIADKTNEKLVIYGDGKLRKFYLDWIKNNGFENRVFLPGNISDVRQVLASGKLFVMSSNYEGMPNSLMEAMASGIPCISTDCPCGGPKELAKDGGVRLVPVGDVECLADEILSFLNGKTNENELIANAKKTSRSYAPDKIYQMWKGYFEYICDKEK